MKEIVIASASSTITDLFSNPNFFILFIVLLIVFFLLGLLFGMIINRRNTRSNTSSSNTTNTENSQQTDTLGQNNQDSGENQYTGYYDGQNGPRNRGYYNYW